MTRFQSSVEPGAQRPSRTTGGVDIAEASYPPLEGPRRGRRKLPRAAREPQILEVRKPSALRTAYEMRPRLPGCAGGAGAATQNGILIARVRQAVAGAPVGDQGQPCRRAERLSVTTAIGHERPCGVRLAGPTPAGFFVYYPSTPTPVMLARPLLCSVIRRCRATPRALSGGACSL